MQCPRDTGQKSESSLLLLTTHIVLPSGVCKSKNMLNVKVARAADSKGSAKSGAEGKQGQKANKANPKAKSLTSTPPMQNSVTISMGCQKGRLESHTRQTRGTGKNRKESLSAVQCILLEPNQGCHCP